MKMPADRVHKLKLPATLRSRNTVVSDAEQKYCLHRPFAFTFSRPLPPVNPWHRLTMAAIHPRIDDLAVGISFPKLLPSRGISEVRDEIYAFLS